jgi:hypothetical protein
MSLAKLNRYALKWEEACPKEFANPPDRIPLPPGGVEFVLAEVRKHSGESTIKFLARPQNLCVEPPVRICPKLTAKSPSRQAAQLQRYSSSMGYS